MFKCAIIVLNLSGDFFTIFFSVDFLMAADGSIAICLVISSISEQLDVLVGDHTFLEDLLWECKRQSHSKNIVLGGGRADNKLSPYRLFTSALDTEVILNINGPVLVINFEEI